jgi:hypothetical protein
MQAQFRLGRGCQSSGKSNQGVANARSVEAGAGQLPRRDPARGTVKRQTTGRAGLEQDVIRGADRDSSGGRGPGPVDPEHEVSFDEAAPGGVASV